MTGQKLWNVGGAIVLIGCFVAALIQVGTRAVREHDPRQITIRLSHWQLEGGMREAFDAVGREYSRMHPNVRIEQTPVPGRVYGAYLRTRVAGGNPPDLMEIGGVPDEWLARYFVPMSQYVETSNPYNAGTDLEKLPWRETFLDGLGNTPGLEMLQDYYSVPFTVCTVRMYYNRYLYRRIMGHDSPPQTYAQFMAVCRQTHEYAQRSRSVVLPVAGSRFNANILLDALMRSQTQKLALDLDQLHLLKPPGHPALAFINHRTTLEHPDVRAGLELMREVGVEMQTGFLQLDRDEAIFYFAQERAVMIATGSWDYQSIAKQSPFDIGVFEIPLPSAQDARFGRGVLGRPSEAGQGVDGYFFLSNRSEHPDVAVDFLRFLTSRRGQQIFVDISQWLPAVVGVKPAEQTRAFAPRMDGSTDGFRIAPIMWGSGEMYRIQSNCLHLLVGKEGGVDPFISAMDGQLDAAVRADAESLQKGYDDNIRRQDTCQIAWRRLGDTGGKLSTIWETQNSQEAEFYWLAHQLQESASTQP